MADTDYGGLFRLVYTLRKMSREQAEILSSLPVVAERKGRFERLLRPAADADRRRKSDGKVGDNKEFISDSWG